MNKNKLKKQKTEWDLSPLFLSDNDNRIETQRNKSKESIDKFVNKWSKRKDYLSEPEILYEALKEYETLLRDYGVNGYESFYFSLRSSQNQLDPEIKAKYAKANEVSDNLQTSLQFFELRLAKIPNQQQKDFLNNKKLLEYKHFLERIFSTANYQLSEPEEKILTLISDPSYGKWVQMVSSFISKEEKEVLIDAKKKEKVTFEKLLTLTTNKNKRVRDDAALQLNAVLAGQAPVAEHEINAILAYKKIEDTLRQMPRPDFSRHIQDDIESSTVDTLLNTVSKRFTIAHKFYSLKAKLMGQDKLMYHERNVEYGKIDKTYTFPESVDFVHKVFTDLDLEFASIFSSFLQNGQIDVYPHKGKRGGAFCAYGLLSQPTYILLNFTGTLRDVTTIAHEAGHGINNELMRKKQNSLNFGTPTATAEVASTFMEDFVLSEILEKADAETQLSVLMTKLNDEVSTIFRQVACYMFEQELHLTFRKLGYLSYDQIGKIFQKHMRSYMGPSVEQSKGSENWWVYWSHIRMFFYVYSYASGLLISKALQNKVKQDPGFIENVKKFLSSGLSESPREIFMRLGIDISDADFWNAGLNEIEELYVRTEKLARSLKKIN